MARKQRHKRDTRGDVTLKRDPSDWLTGDEPMTKAQESYLRTLGTEVGVRPSKNMTKAEASREITRLQKILKRRRRMH